ncbi:hypothetical protein ACFQ3K_14675 [Brucella gallinifaecis]|uniref:Uncharacterized protein n=1 Tax=Brucella gallinifaecis TaxID=215590 RepID=A0A502BSP2_9HYPH|nr:hypothetical protein [Brucella gallinifaecis]TPF76709.1 hypothetical protein FHY56_04235 [Brucella gallinifaecis]
MSIHQFPRCAAYLKGMRVNLNDPEMTDYWFAVILGDRMPKEELERDGINFNRHERDGIKLLQGIERILVEGRNKSKVWASEALKAFIGSRGVKASKLKTIEDFWKVAAILWPQHIKGKIGSLDQLEAHIRSLSKKQRQAARENLKRVPAEFRTAF